MAISHVNDSRYWRDRAAEMRALSDMMSDIDAAAIMLRLATTTTCLPTELTFGVTAGSRQNAKSDVEARQVEQIVANELSRNRYDGEEIAVLVFNDDGQLIHRVWTRAPVTMKQKLFPEHVHPKGFYQIGPRRYEQPAVVQRTTDL
jgi:hypothetical protein